MSWNLFVDPVLDPIQITDAPDMLATKYRVAEWYIVRSVEEAERLIYVYGMPDFISFSSDTLGLNVASIILSIDRGTHAYPYFAGYKLSSDFNFWVHTPKDEINLTDILERALSND